MIVYVESNFLLEATYLQEEHESCDAILSLAETGRVTLAVPAFSIAEARISLLRQIRQRAEFHESLSRQIRELSRSKPYSDVSSRSRELISALVDSGEEERRRLGNVTRRVLEAGRILAVTAEVLQRADAAEGELDLSPQDAIVYASVILDVERDPDAPKCFLNRNSRDFANPDIYAELRRGNCRLLTSFRNGLGFIGSSTP